MLVEMRKVTRPDGSVVATLRRVPWYERAWRWLCWWRR